MIGTASRAPDGAVVAEVRLEALPRAQACSGTGSVIRFETDVMTPITLIQERPGLDDTAYGVVSDLAAVCGW